MSPSLLTATNVLVPLEKSSVPTPTDTLDSFVETIGKIYDQYADSIDGMALLILIEVINLQGELCVTLIN